MFLAIRYSGVIIFVNTNHISVNERIIGAVTGTHSGPTLVFVGGCHGDESGAVDALSLSMNKLKAALSSKKTTFRGNVYAVAGNLKALSEGKRFVDEDLNRIWKIDRIAALENHNESPATSESKELRELLSTFKLILANSSGPFIFVDVHTTTTRTVPHILINDLLENRKKSFRYPLPVILGVDTFVEGTMLSFVNEMGHVAMGFEAGPNNQVSTRENVEAFFWLSLAFNGLIRPDLIPDFKSHSERLHVASQGYQDVFELGHNYKAGDNELFELVSGYHNFQPVVKGQYIGHDRRGTVLAQSSGYIFIPKWTAEHAAGFFLLRKVSRSWLGFSAVLRKVRAERLLVLLPGVKQSPDQEDEYRINVHLARFFAAEIFRMLGYRLYRKDGKLFVSRRLPNQI